MKLILFLLMGIVFDSQASQFNIEKFSKSLPNKSFSRSSRSSVNRMHIVYSYLFSKPEAGGRMSVTINGDRKLWPFSSYNIYALDEGHEGLEVAVGFDKKLIKGIIETINDKGEVFSWVLIINENCLIDPINTGKTLQDCLTPDTASPRK